MVDLWHVPGVPLEVDTGITRLQEIKIREMNQHGMPTIGLVYVRALGVFRVTNLLRGTLSGPGWYVKKGGHKGNVIDGHELMTTAQSYLKEFYA